MRAVVRCVLAVVGIAAGVAAGPAGTSLAAANLPHDAAIASVLPARGATVGVAHPVVVTFKAPVADRHAAERGIGVKSTPAMTGRFEWLDNNVVQWVPNRYWPAHSAVALSVGGLSTEFQTGPKVIGVANTSQHTFTVSIDGVDAGPPPALPAPHHRPHFGEEGVLPASMGRPEFATPVGNYTVLSKERSVLMDSSTVGIPVDDPAGYLVKVDYAVRITSRGLFVHSAPWAVRSLGLENVSHGCISLGPEDAEWYYNTVNVGDPVIVEENLWERPPS
jgi:lipoprotein-anchoring transpeptidase ErfK/SrfK